MGKANFYFAGLLEILIQVGFDFISYRGIWNRNKGAFLHLHIYFIIININISVDSQSIKNEPIPIPMVINAETVCHLLNNFFDSLFCIGFCQVMRSLYFNFKLPMFIVELIWID